jgi:hypothetical protein
VAARIAGSGQVYSRALSLGSQTALTACFWWKISVDLNTWSSALFIDNGQADNWGVQTGADGTTANAVMDGNSTASVAMTVGTWYFIGLATSGTTGTLYYKAAGSSTLSTTAITGVTATSAATLRLGDSPWGEWLNGCLAAVKVWNAQLTAAEIDLEAQQYAVNKIASLVSFHPLVKAETADYSGNARTLSGGTGATTEDGPPIPWRLSSPRLTLPTAASGITGTAAVTQAGDVSAASGQLGYSGTASPTQAANTSSASGTVINPVTGTVAVTQAGNTSIASGQLGYSGTSARTQANQTSAASGQLGYSGTAAATQANQTSSASGTYTAGGSFSGSAAVTQANQTSAATGKLGYSATATPTQANNTSTASGTVVNPVTGTASPTQVSQTAAASGVLRYTGTLAVSQASSTATIQGVVFIPITGTLARTQANQTANASGSALGATVIRPNTGTTSRPSSGATSRPFSGVTPRP